MVLPTRGVVNNRLVTLLAMALCAMLVGAPCRAAEGGLGAYLPGYRNFMAGFVPAKPGLYLRDDTIGYSATAPRVVLNGLPVENVETNAILNVIQPTYVFPWKLWGASHSFLWTQPLVWLELSGGIIGTDVTPSGNRFAPGDPVISPLYLGWRKGDLHYNANLAIFIPTGDYDIHRVVNTTLNYWTFDPQFGITHFNPKTGWDFSGVIGYSFNTENPATDYTSGQVLHLDLAVGRTLPNGIKPGIIGYMWLQVTPDSGSGALFGSFESRVFGIGPAVEWKAGDNAKLMLRYLHEFGARDRLEGDQAALSLKMSF